jgi:hypothetical protein
MNYPHPGVAGSKPRLSKSAGNGASSKEEFAKLSHEYLEIRNRTQSAKAFLAETQASRQRGELIDKKWAFDSLSYLLVCYRQKALLAHRAIARRLVRLGFIDAANEHSTARVLDEEIRSLLVELANLPGKVTDPDWLKTLEKENVGADERDRRQATTPKEHQREQARVEHRRQKQTEAKRKERAKG